MATRARRERPAAASRDAAELAGRIVKGRAAGPEARAGPETPPVPGTRAGAGAVGLTSVVAVSETVPFRVGRAVASSTRAFRSEWIWAASWYRSAGLFCRHFRMIRSRPDAISGFRSRGRAGSFSMCWRPSSNQSRPSKGGRPTAIS
jgi:hypothetical protein